ncbi:MAG: CoA pyrophosphatase [Wenzhouxiangellaceae bacterium]|nr:MAG: CoA pyrophosphatase [Wenzhouxiangellaceae bacterium]
MTSSSTRLLNLAAALHPLETELDRLPVVGYRPSASNWSPAPAAVLVPILVGEDGGVVLTVRSRALTHHAGQVSLPGGGPQDGEGFPLATALREAGEEIGLPEQRVRPLGLLACCDTITAFRIVPVVALVPASVNLKPNHTEVSETFTLPLDLVLDPDSYRRHEVLRGGDCFEAWSMKSGHRPVWGATAAILREMALLATSGSSTEG